MSVSPSLTERLRGGLQAVREQLPGGRLARAVRNADRFSTASPGQHWAIDHFPPQPRPGPPGGRVCPLGSITRAEHFSGSPTGPPEIAPNLPFDEEYFEWTDILESVLDAGDTYTFLDIGAGYGRWTSRAAGAARIKGKRFRAFLAEAEPQHIAWAYEHMADNDITDYRLFEAAVGAERRRTPMTISRPKDQDVGHWFGQSIGWGDISYLPVVDEYYGSPVVETDAGWRFMEVAEIPLTDMLEPLDFVDLIDMDIQGAEAPAVRCAIEALTAKVRRMHIETHGKEIEVELRSTLGGAGWRLLRDYTCMETARTPFGDAWMEGGVQTWINPTLLAPR